MQEVQKELENIGHEVKLPPHEITDENGQMMLAQDFYRIRKTATTDKGWIWDEKEKAIRNHFEKVAWSDAVLILNYSKNNVEKYVGANTFLEMGLAFHFGKKIFLLNPIPDIPCKEELLGMKPIVINNNLSLLA